MDFFQILTILLSAGIIIALSIISKIYNRLNKFESRMHNQLSLTMDQIDRLSTKVKMGKYNNHTKNNSKKDTAIKEKI